MGADMILYSCSYPSNLGLNHEGAKDRIRAYCKSMGTGEIEGFLDHVNGESLEELYFEAFGEPTPLEELAELEMENPPDRPDPEIWARERILKQLLEDYAHIFENGTRETTELRLGGLSYIFSGGVTWGDSVSDACEPIGRLDYTGIFDVFERKGVLDLSTGHIPAKKLRMGASDLNVEHRCQAHEMGWIVFLGNEEEDKNCDAWFKPIVALARAAQCDFINFDRDGDKIEFLPYYEEDT